MLIAKPNQCCRAVPCVAGKEEDQSYLTSVSFVVEDHLIGTPQGLQQLEEIFDAEYWLLLFHQAQPVLLRKLVSYLSND